MPLTKRNGSTSAHHGHSIFLLDRGTKCNASWADFDTKVVPSVSAVQSTVASAQAASTWVSYEGDLTGALVERAVAAAKRFGQGVFVHPIAMESIPVLQSLFRRIAFGAVGAFLSQDELVEALSAGNRADLFIGGMVNPANRTITFWRGNLASLAVPFDDFRPSRKGAKPDFSAFSLTDGGQTVKLGEYEAAVDAILYERDPEFRRALTKRRLQEERSFGAALRRLRKQRGLRREDFEPDVTAKTIARIEQGRVTRIQKKTRDSLAKHLKVDPSEIESF